MRLKISKEVAIDCVVEVAKENEYDPVRSLPRTLRQHRRRPPTSTDSPAPTSGHKTRIKTEATLYDNMLKCTLIAAVAGL